MASNETVRRNIQSLYGIEKSQTNDLEKGGEGSRGGKIIGHTKSGKPIYENSQYHSAGFTHEDHSDAMTAHMKASTEHSEKSKKHLEYVQEHSSDRKKNAEYGERFDLHEKHKKQSQHHSTMASLHQTAMNQKLDENGK